MPKTVPAYERMKEVNPDYMDDLEALSEAELLKEMGYDPELDEEEEEEDSSDDQVEDESEDEEVEGTEEEDESEDEGNDDSEDDEAQDENESDEDQEVEQTSENEEDDGKFIPKARSDERVEIERQKYAHLEEKFKLQEQRSQWLEEQIRSIQQNQQVSTKEVEKATEEVFDFDKAQREYNKAIILGEDEDAVRLMSQINSEREKQFNRQLEALEKKLLEKTAKSHKELTDGEKLNVVLENARSKYSMLDDKSDEYDLDLANDIDALAQGYMGRSGITAHEAYQKAIERTMKKVVKEEKVTETKETKQRKKVKASKISKQPQEIKASKKGKGLDLDTLDVSKMSDDDFAKLSQKDLNYLLNRE